MGWLAANFQIDTLVDPFCGSGTVLAAANAFGLQVFRKINLLKKNSTQAAGCDLSKKRVRQSLAITGDVLLRR